MKKRFIYWIILVLLIFVLAYFIFSSSIFENINNKASLTDANYTSILDDVKAYVTDNISKYNEDTIIFTKNDLLINSIIKEDSKIDDTSRIYVKINDGVVTDAYIKNRSINDYLMKEVKTNNFVLKDNNYYFVGNEVSNYIEFNNELYRIIKVNNEGNILIIKNDQAETIKKEKIDSYIQMFKNKKIYSYVKNATVLNVSDYDNTVSYGRTFLESSYKYFINTSNGYVVVNGLFENEDEATIKMVIEIDKDASYEKGVGTIIDPIIISE